MSEPVLELTLRGTDKVAAYACGTCQVIAHSKALAEQCCLPNVCACGNTCDRYYTSCRKCIDKKHAERETARFEAATKVHWQSYGGPVFDGDEFHDSLESYLDSIEPNEQRAYVWACESFGLGRIDVWDDVLNPLLERQGHHEEAHEHIVDDKQLQSFLNSWVALQPVKSWRPDYRRAVLTEGAAESFWPEGAV